MVYKTKWHPLQQQEILYSIKKDRVRVCAAERETLRAKSHLKSSDRLICILSL